jgi:hypothetical protein
MTAIFPSLPGLGWSVVKSPRFATRIQRAVNGRELRALDQPNPIWSWTLTYPLLRDRSDARAPSGAGIGYDELRTLAGFFLQQQGALQPFLFDDPTDNAVTAQPLGAGDSSRAVFQLLRTMGSFAEPVTAPNAVSAIYFDGILQPAADTPSMPRPASLPLPRRRLPAGSSPPISPIFSACGSPTTPPNSRTS